MQCDLDLDGPFVKTVVGLGLQSFVPVVNISQPSEGLDKSAELRIVLRSLSSDSGTFGENDNEQFDTDN